MNSLQDKRRNSSTSGVAVLYLTANPNRASSNVSTEGWFRVLPERGLRPVLVSNSAGAFHDWASSISIPSYVMPLPNPDKWRPWKYLATLSKLVGIVRRFKIQLVHAIEENVYPIAADLTRWCRLPVMVGVHSRVERGFSEWAFGGRRQPDRLLFLSRGGREASRPAVEGLVPESKWRILPNGLNIERFCPDRELGQAFRQEHSLGDGLLIGAASWLRPGKQLEHTFQAVAALDDDAVKLVLAGGVSPGEEEYARGLLDYGAKLLGPKLRYLGCLSDLRGFYNALTMYINTSAQESFGISVLEALACGRPVVGYDSKAIDELVLPAGGEITPQDDVSALTAAVKLCLGQPARLEEMGIAARRQAQRFDIRAIADQLWEEYQEIVAGRIDPNTPANLQREFAAAHS